MRSLIVVLLLLPAVGASQQAPPIATKGLDLLVAGQCEAGFRAWTAGWTAPDDSMKRETLIGTCTVLPQFGKLNGYDIIRVVSVTPNLTRVYVLLRYDLQPLYLLLVAYRPKDDWKVITVTWNTLPEKVFPPDILPSEHPGP